MTPAELLDAARDVLADTSAATAGWPRMVALLTRQALEEALSEFWEGQPSNSRAVGLYPQVPARVPALLPRRPRRAGGCLRLGSAQ